MTEHDDLHADDRRLRAALRSLPAPRAGEGFTEEVLARLDGRAAGPPAAVRPRRWRGLALTVAAAAAALAVAVGGEGLWPSGRWLWIGVDRAPAGKGGAAVESGTAVVSETVAGVRASGRETGEASVAAPGSVPEPSGRNEGAARAAHAASDAPADGRVGGREARPEDRRPGGPAGSGSRPAASAPIGEVPEVPEAPAEPSTRSATAVGEPVISRRAADRTAGDRPPFAAPIPEAAASASGAATPTPAAAAEPAELTEAEAAVRLALLRDRRERLLADLRALRAAVPPEEPAGLLLAGGESIDVVLGLGPGAARPAVQRPGASEARPAILRRDERPPRLY